MRPTVPASSFFATILITIAAILIVGFFDLFLAGVARRASDGQAKAQYLLGQQLLSAGSATAASDHFEAAVASDRQNTLYALGLSEALLGQDKLDDAEATLRALLDRSENDGAVNLTMARVMAREGRLDEATAYFHRAIYGQWGSDSVTERMKVRVELIDLLVRRRASRALAAELLPLEEEAADSMPLRLWIGERLILAGSPARAAGEFRQVIQRDPQNASAYAGLGNVALQLGNLRSARAELAQAARLAPTDPAIAQRLNVADTALALDPTAPDLSLRARADRSRALLARTLARVIGCGLPAANPVADSARTMLALRGEAEEAGQRMLTLATELWGMRTTNCTVALRDEPLALVQAHLAQ